MILCGSFCDTVSFLLVILCGPFQSTNIFACYCYCFVAGVKVVHLFSFLCCVLNVARVFGVSNPDYPFGFL